MCKTNVQQDFDSPWKEALDAYFPSFLLFFFPKVYAAVDWSRGYVFLDKEFQKITRDAEQGRRYVDKLVRVFRNDGKETWLLIHVEIQGQPDANFPERMFVYYYRIIDRYKRETVSLGVLSDSSEDFRPGPYTHECLGCGITFTFPVAKVLDYGKDWSKLEQSDNAFAMVVMAHLKAQEIGVGEGEERRRWKLHLIRLLYDQGYGRKDVLQLFRFIDWLLILPPELEQGFAEELHKIEEERKVEYITSVERIGIEKGFQEGIDQGIQQGGILEAKNMLTELLSLRFAMPQEEAVRCVEGVTEYKVLKQLFREAVQCDDLGKFQGRVAEVLGREQGRGKGC